MASVLCQLHVCTYNRFSMSSFWFSDRHDIAIVSYYNYDRPLTNRMEVLKLLFHIFFVEPRTGEENLY